MIYCVPNANIAGQHDDHQYSLLQMEEHIIVPTKKENMNRVGEQENRMHFNRLFAIVDITGYKIHLLNEENNISIETSIEDMKSFKLLEALNQNDYTRFNI